MDINTFTYGKIDEKIYEYTHESGLKAFVIPKKGYKKIYATFATHYGSINNKFIIPEETEPTIVPDGIAHFLEHKLFEQEDGNVMEKFSKLGSNTNAYTGFAQTVYLFSCTDKFIENFQILLKFVQSPYLTDENVEAEKGIIGQEIDMLRDNPSRMVLFNLLDAFYRDNPVKIEIGGTKESISKINKELLYKCYNTFYHPSNMMVLVVGDVNYEEVFENVKKNIKTTQYKSEIKRIFPDEPAGVNKKVVESIQEISNPIILMGYKDEDLKLSGKFRLKKEICVNILLEMIMGKSSELYSELYNSGLINASFEYDFTTEECYAFSSFGGETLYPIELKDKILTKIHKLTQNSISEVDFDRVRNSQIGKFIKGLNSVEWISNVFISTYFKDVNIFEYYDIYENITISDIENELRNHFKDENFAISIIYPKKK